MPVASVQVPTGHGATHVLISGAETASAVLLIPGGGHTATVWSGVAARLSASYRVIAVDPVGQAGLSVPGGRPLSAKPSPGAPDPARGPLRRAAPVVDPLGPTGTPVIRLAGTGLVRAGAAQESLA